MGLVRMRKAACVAVVVLAGLSVLGCTAPKAGGAGPTSRPPASPGAGSSAAASRTFDAGNPALGPRTAEIGRSYPFDLYVHCGGAFTTFAGATWQTATPPGDVVPTPDAKGTVTYTGYLAGWMTQTGADVAVFTVAGTTQTVLYQRTTAPPQVCM